jgi:hypothetical protein
LKEIAEGYLLLDQRGPGGVIQAKALGAKLRELEPKKPDGFVIEADADYRLGNYPEAAALARRAWESGGRSDRRALTLMKMSEGRAAASPSATPSAAPAPANASPVANDPSLPYKLPVRVTDKPIVVPDAPSAPAAPKGGLPLLPLGAAGLGLGLAGVGLYRGAKGAEVGGESEAPAPSRSVSDAAADYASRAKQLIEDHPYSSAAVLLLGAALVVLLAVGTGGGAAGGGLALAAANGAPAAVSAGAAGATVTAADATATAAAGAAILTMSGDTRSSGNNDKPRRRRTTRSFKEAVRRLGLDENKASEELHKIKRLAGRGGAANVEFDIQNGDVIEPETGEVIGNLAD